MSCILDDKIFGEMFHRSVVIAVISLLLCFVNLGQGCLISYSPFRRKRTTAEEVEETVKLREYFIACMYDKVGGSENWQAEVDYTVLDSAWHKDTEDFSCLGDSTASCWMDELENFVSSSAAPQILNAGKECIEQYENDWNANIFVYQHQLSKRKKRQAFPPNFPGNPSAFIDVPGFFSLARYSNCLLSGVIPTNGRNTTDYQSLAASVYRYLRYSCDKTQSNEDQTSTDWAYRFLALTRADSPLRDSLLRCNNLIYPPDSFWSGYGKWSPCSSSCGAGRQTRVRTCRDGRNPQNQAPGQCTGINMESRSCIGSGKFGITGWTGWTPWNSWTPCLRRVEVSQFSCLQYPFGSQQRSRTYLTGNQQQVSSNSCGDIDRVTRFCTLNCAQ